MTELASDDVVIVIIGPSGTGKSTFINVATENEPGLRTSTGLDTCTTTIGHASCIHKGRRFVFIDTPPVESTNSLITVRQGVGQFMDAKKKSREGLIETVKSYFKKGKTMKIHGAIYLHRITDNKATDETLKKLRTTRKFDGAKVVVATTMWGEKVESDKKVNRMSELQEFWAAGEKPDNSSRGDVMEHLNTKESAWDIIGKLM